MSAYLVAALLSLFLHSPARPCVEARQQAIARALDTAYDHGFPPVVLLAVGWTETHAGCDAGESGGWGAPASPTRRHTAGGPERAAQALAWGYRRCGSNLGAVSHFRCGLCRCPAGWYRRMRTLRAATPEAIMDLAGRIEARMLSAHPEL